MLRKGMVVYFKQNKFDLFQNSLDENDWKYYDDLNIN